MTVAAGAHPAESSALESPARREWYLSDDFFHREQSMIFAGSWVMAGSGEDLPAPGDYLAVEVAGEPIVLVRDGSGSVRAYRNICRHRGVVLLDGTGHIESSIVCPYHDWAYGLDGRLERVPQRRNQFAGLDPDCWGLLTVPVFDWHGLLFVNIDGRAGNFQTCSAPLFERLDPLLTGPVVHLATQRHRVRANWKILLENHLDFYHLWYLHRDSLAQYRHAAVRREQFDGHFWSVAPLIDTASAPTDLWWASDEERTGIGAHLLFPNLGIVTTGAYVVMYDAVPVGPRETIFTVRIRGRSGAPVDRYLEEIHAFLDEDMAVCERIQAGVASTAWNIGPLARDHERPVVAFQAAVARHLD